MHKRKYTIVAQLHRANNKELIEYFERAVGLFSKLQRKAFHMLKYETVSGNKTEYKRFRQSFMQQYGISRRTADSILKDVQGRMKALAELKKLEEKQKEIRLGVLQSEIQILDRKITKLQDQLNKGMEIDHVQYWNLKKTRAFKKMRLNKLPCRRIGTTIDISQRSTLLQGSSRAADRYSQSRPAALLAHTCCPVRCQNIRSCEHGGYSVAVRGLMQ